MLKIESSSYLPHPGHSVLFSPRRQWWTASSPQLPRHTARSPSPSDFYSCIGLHASHSCREFKCRGSLHEVCVTLFGFSLFFFLPMELLGAEAKLRCYWLMHAQSPASLHHVSKSQLPRLLQLDCREVQWFEVIDDEAKDAVMSR